VDFSAQLFENPSFKVKILQIFCFCFFVFFLEMYLSKHLGAKATQKTNEIWQINPFLSFVTV